jgi:hypothetical protein
LFPFLHPFRRAVVFRSCGLMTIQSEVKAQDILARWVGFNLNLRRDNPVEGVGQFGRGGERHKGAGGLP